MISADNELASITVYDSLSISLELEFEPNWICDDEWCQILQIGFLELAVRPGDLQMAITTESGTMQYVVGNLCLEGHCNDGGRHLIEVKISPNEREITYDHTTLLRLTGDYLRSDYVDADGEDHSLFVNGEPVDGQSSTLEGTLRNLCITTFDASTPSMEPTVNPTVNPTVDPTAESIDSPHSTAMLLEGVSVDPTASTVDSVAITVLICCIFIFCVAVVYLWFISEHRERTKCGAPCCVLAAAEEDEHEVDLEVATEPENRQSLMVDVDDNDLTEIWKSGMDLNEIFDVELEGNGPMESGQRPTADIVAERVSSAEAVSELQPQTVSMDLGAANVLEAGTSTAL